MASKGREVEIDHGTVQQWVVKYTPILEVEFRKRKKSKQRIKKHHSKYLQAKPVALNYKPLKTVC